MLAKIAVFIGNHKFFILKLHEIQKIAVTLHAHFENEVPSGCSAVGSALRSGRRGRAFESPHPDNTGLSIAGVGPAKAHNELTISSRESAS